MTHDEAFLEAIREAPDDDAPRLLYADWLEERGDPRGEFIRAQCVLERLDPADPIRLELEDEAQALLGRHEEEWTAPLRGAASEWRFRRGFVEEAVVAGSGFLEHADLLSEFPIVKLRMKLSPEQAVAVAASPGLGRLRFLDVSSCDLRDRGVTTLLSSPHLSRLTGLDLAGNDVEGPALRTLAESPLLSRLTTLNLNRNGSLGLRALRTVAHAPAAAALQSLGLSCTNIGLAGLRDLLSSPFLKSLTALQAANVGGYVTGGLVAPDLDLLPGFSRLTALDLGGFPASAGLWRLLRSPSLGRLTGLKLSGCGLGDDAEALADLPPFAGLQTLDLSNNRVGPRGLERLAASERLSGLTALHLGHNAVRDAGAKALAASSTLTRLTVLNLSDNAIGGPGIRALAASPNVVRLTSLDLSGNYINLDSVRALTAAPPLRRLRELRLGGSGRAEAEILTAILADAPDGPFVPHDQGWWRRRFAARRARNATVPPVTMGR